MHVKTAQHQDSRSCPRGMGTIRHISEALWERKSQLAGHSPQHKPTFHSLLGENQAKPPLHLHTSINSFGEDGDKYGTR